MVPVIKMMVCVFSVTLDIMEKIAFKVRDFCLTSCVCAFLSLEKIILWSTFFVVVCPANCKNGICDKATSSCIACSDGFWGETCTMSK